MAALEECIATAGCPAPGRDRPSRPHSTRPWSSLKAFAITEEDWGDMSASVRHDTATEAARQLYFALQNGWPVIPADRPPDGVLEHGEQAIGVFYPHDRFRLDYARWVGADVVVT